MITDTELFVIRKAIQNLQTIGCKVGIVDKDGNGYGGFSLMPVGEVKRKRAAPMYKRGTLSNYLEPYLNLLTEAGDVIDVPMSPLFENTSRLNGAVSAYMCNHYGKGSHKVEANEDQTSVRVYRIEPKKEQND